MHQKFGPVDYLLNGKTGYLLRRALRYEIAQVSPRMHTRFLTAVRRGRILSDLQRRMRQVLPRRVVTAGCVITMGGLCRYDRKIRQIRVLGMARQARVAEECSAQCS